MNGHDVPAAIKALFDPPVWIDAVLKLGFFESIALMLAITACFSLVVLVSQAPKLLKIYYDHKVSLKKLDVETSLKKDKARLELEKAIARRLPSPKPPKPEKGD